MLHYCIILLFFIFGSTVNLYSQNIKFINESTNLPIEGVLVETNRNFLAISNKDGIVNISEINDNEQMFISHKSFSTLILLKSELPKNYIIKLNQRDYYLPEVSVKTPPLRGYINVHDEPHQIIAISKKDVLYEKPATTADMLQNTGQVMVQKSQGGGGSPILRGFEANKLLLVIDGVRMNNAIYRSGHLQNSITISPTMLDETEIIFGPSSVLYGSDALGGVIHFHTKNPKLADSTKWNNYNDFSAFYDYQTGLTANFTTNIAQKKWGLLMSTSFSDYTDYEMGKNRYHGYQNWGLDSTYAGTFEGIDSVIFNPNPNLQKNIGFKQADFISKLYFKPSEKIDYTFNFQLSSSSNINRFDKLNEYKDGTLKYAEWYYGPQKRLFASTKVNFTPEKKWINAGSFILSYQKLDEDRISRKFKSDFKDYQIEDVNVFALNLDLNKVIDSSKVLYYGIEVQDNFVTSTAYSQNISTQDKSNFQTRYPDGGSQYLSSGLYVAYKQNINKKVLFTTGLRYSLIYAQSVFKDTTFIKLPFNSVSFTTSAPSGNVGVIYQADTRTLIKSSISTGFRAPNIDDYGKVFEKKGNTVVPTNQLKPEYAINGELSGERIFGRNTVTLGASTYYTFLFNAMVRSNSTLNGVDSILYDGDWTNVQTNINTDKAQIYGVSAFIKWRVIKHLYLNATYNFTKGTDLSQGKPLTHIPPQFGKIEMNFKNEKFTTALYSYYNLAKKLKDYGGNSDNIEEATPEGTPAWATLNFKFSYIGFKSTSIHFKATNLMDIHYKPFASAISAPGRSFMIGFKTTF